MRTQVGRQRAVAVHPGVGAPNALLGRAPVVHRKGVHVQRQPAAGQYAVVRPLAAQQRLDHPGHMLEHRAGLGVHALAQRRARRQQLDAQRLLEELVAPRWPTIALDGVEVALALHQQPQVRPHDVGVAHARAHRQRRIELGPLRAQRLQVVAHQDQPAYGVRSESSCLTSIRRMAELSANSPSHTIGDHPAGVALPRWGHGFRIDSHKLALSKVLN